MLEIIIRADPDGTRAEIRIIIVRNIVVNMAEAQPHAPLDAELLVQKIFCAKNGGDIKGILIDALDIYMLCHI